MYITGTTKNVINLIEKLEIAEEVTKLKFLIYIFNLLNNNQINDQNEANPELVENMNMKVFNLSILGFPENTCNIFMEYLSTIYNKMVNMSESYIENCNILGINYEEYDMKLCSQFEKLNFYEKLDVFSEIIIRYDNKTYFNKITTISLNPNGYEIATQIQQFKGILI